MVNVDEQPLNINRRVCNLSEKQITEKGGKNTRKV